MLNSSCSPIANVTGTCVVQKQGLKYATQKGQRHSQFLIPTKSALLEAWVKEPTSCLWNAPHIPSRKFEERANGLVILSNDHLKS